MIKSNCHHRRGKTICTTSPYFRYTCTLTLTHIHVRAHTRISTLNTHAHIHTHPCTTTSTCFLMFLKIRGENLLPCTTCNHRNYNTPSCLNSLISHQPQHLQTFRRCNTCLSNFLVILFLSSFSFIYHTSKIWKDVVTSCSDVNDCRCAST